MFDICYVGSVKNHPKNCFNKYLMRARVKIIFDQDGVETSTKSTAIILRFSFLKSELPVSVSRRTVRRNSRYSRFQVSPGTDLTSHPSHNFESFQIQKVSSGTRPTWQWPTILLHTHSSPLSYSSFILSPFFRRIKEATAATLCSATKVGYLAIVVFANSLPI
jgi:hypothetical protein